VAQSLDLPFRDFVVTVFLISLKTENLRINKNSCVPNYSQQFSFYFVLRIHYTYPFSSLFDFILIIRRYCNPHIFSFFITYLIFLFTKLQKTLKTRSKNEYQFLCFWQPDFVKLSRAQLNTRHISVKKTSTAYFTGAMISGGS
jgi:hypothetical protein